MKVSLDTVRTMAHLARLDFDPEAEVAMQHDLSRILDWVEKLKEVDVEGVEPLIHPSEELDAWVEDVPAAPLPRPETLRNAPDHDGTHFRVPRVIE
ncbi:MAG: Asp-tRNA(Asn)/Glu-tRNA(Gln) amidotransferase subunit GatC [Catalinimonas sp.]